MRMLKVMEWKEGADPQKTRRAKSLPQLPCSPSAGHLRDDGERGHRETPLVPLFSLQDSITYRKSGECARVRNRERKKIGVTPHFFEPGAAKADAPFFAPPTRFNMDRRMGAEAVFGHSKRLVAPGSKREEAKGTSFKASNAHEAAFDSFTKAVRRSPSVAERDTDPGTFLPQLDIE